MTRSEINRILLDADAFARSLQFRLPPFAYWTLDDWAKKGPEAREIVEHGLGWDITDFGKGKYRDFGLFLFTIRNGSKDAFQRKAGKVYAEKILIVDDHQMTPLHYHWFKTEDIINRGGADMAIQLFQGNEDGSREENGTIKVSIDGETRVIGAGDTVILKPGESITLPPYLYHAFWGEGGRVLMGEVSTVNDDNEDNCFFQPVGRFPEIEEDVPPVHLLVNDYPAFAPGVLAAA